MELFASDGDRLAYKTKGLAVAANDRLRYCYHTARAIIENRNARLSDEGVKTLVSDIPRRAPSFATTSRDCSSLPASTALIDTIRATLSSRRKALEGIEGVSILVGRLKPE